MMKKRLLILLLALGLLCTMFPGMTCAEGAPETGSETDEAAQTASEVSLSAEGLTKLPMDDYTAFGPVPDSACFTAGKHIYSHENSFDDGCYIDQSIAVYVWREWRDKCCYNVARIKIADPSQLRTALWHNSIRQNNYVWKTAEEFNAVVACGGEFLAHTANKHTHAVRMGVTLRDEGAKKRDTMITDQNGDFHLFKGYSDDQRKALEKEGTQVINLFNFGPALIIDGELQYHEGEKLEYFNIAPNGTQPRTAIGQLGPLEYLMVVTHGRNVKAPVPEGGQKASAGCTIVKLAQFMNDYHCIQAYNLDGGGSAAMYYNGDIFTFNRRRAVTDIVYFATLVDTGKAAE